MLSRQEKKALKDKIVAMVLLDDEDRAAWMLASMQKRPYTGVNVAAVIPFDDGELFTAVGFSKAHWPDKWDPDYGLELAIKKAAADIVRQWDEYLDSKLEGVIDD